eukprot:1159344-Pelagomonas_calceolata.AAC.3
MEDFDCWEKGVHSGHRLVRHLLQGMHSWYALQGMHSRVCTPGTALAPGYALLSCSSRQLSNVKITYYS